MSALCSEALALLRRTDVGDDVAYVYCARCGTRRFIVGVSLAPDAQLAALMVTSARAQTMLMTVEEYLAYPSIGGVTMELVRGRSAVAR